MKVKILEIRDRMTFIPAMATLVEPENEDQRSLLSAAGFSIDENQSNYVILTSLEKIHSEYSPYAWGGRTMPNAHQFIINKFDTLKDGDVIDVEFILGETTTKKERQ